MKKPEIKNLKKVAERIKKAVEGKENIILYGDSDLDGVGSIVLLKESIQNLGGKIAAVFFPDRENDGYGITEKALNHFKDKVPALLISADLGIGNFKEVDIANKMGFEVIIIDHHEILGGKLPKASIIVDPKQKGDKYPLKQFATVGLVFRLAEVLLKDKLAGSLRDSFLELTALATIADMMPVIEDNKLFIDEGMSVLKKTFRPGLRAFFEVFEEKSLVINNLQRMISALNVCEIKDHINETFSLLTSSDINEAKEIVKNLLEKNLNKQHRIHGIVQEIDVRVNSKLSELIIFEGDNLWQLSLAGSAASIVSQKYGKPAFIFKKGETESVGSVRVPKGINSVDAMATCADFLITYGGHPPASGFRIKNENLDKFKECLVEYIKKKK